MNYLSVRTVAKLLRMDTTTIYRLIRRGEIPAVQLGAALRIPSSLVEDWLEDEIERQTMSRMHHWYISEAENHGHA